MKDNKPLVPTRAGARGTAAALDKLAMTRLVFILLLLVSHDVRSEATTILTLPESASLSFETPQMVKLKEVSEGGRYQYLASSVDGVEQRFNLSVYVDPIDCHFGESTRQITRCFLEKSDLIPGIVKESRSTRCDEDRRCEVIYFTAVKVGESIVRQLHGNTIFSYGGRWVDVHISVINPAGDYAKLWLDSQGL